MSVQTLAITLSRTLITMSCCIAKLPLVWAYLCLVDAFMKRVSLNSSDDIALQRS